MKDYQKEIWADILLMVGLVVGCISCGLILGHSAGTRQIQQQAIRAGVAHYNSTNAVFEWNTLTNK